MPTFSPEFVIGDPNLAKQSNLIKLYTNPLSLICRYDAQAMSEGLDMKSNHNSNFKTCSKCQFEFISSEDFQELTSFVGIMETGKYSRWNLELRNCKCGTTLARKCPKTSCESRNLGRLAPDLERQIA